MEDEKAETNNVNVDEQKIEALANLLSTNESTIKLYLGQPLNNDELVNICELAEYGSYVGLKSLKLLIKQTDVNKMIRGLKDTLERLDKILWLIELHGLEVKTDEIGQVTNPAELELADKILAIAIRLETELDMAYENVIIETVINAINNGLLASITARNHIETRAYDAFCYFFLENYNNPEVFIDMAMSRRTQNYLMCDSEAENDVAKRLAELDLETLQKAVDKIENESEENKEEQDRMNGTGVAHYSGSGEDQQITSQITNVSVP